MKKTIALCALALITVGFSSARAADDVNTRPFRFDFACTFTGVAADVQAPTPTDGTAPSSFTASARVFADVQKNSTPSLETLETLANSQNMNDYIAIFRDGGLVYADSAVLYSNPHHVVITGSNGTSPALVIDRDDHRVAADGNMCHKSALKFGDHVAAIGECCVKTTPVRGEEELSSTQLQ
jgi:hypothetical protein